MIKDLLKKHPILPIIQADSIEEGLKAMEAIQQGGLSTVEITLRTPASQDFIKHAVKAFPEFTIAVGTITQPQDLQITQDLGASFGVSPGLNPELLTAAQNLNLPLLPGVATPSDVMLGLQHGYDTLKLFPAGVLGGTDYLKALSGPFNGVNFCPTGGVHGGNFMDFLKRPNVLSVGGTWLVPLEKMKAKDWPGITKLIQESLTTLKATIP